MPQPRRVSTDRVDVQMTPLIDVVFQLLTFFLMTLRIAPPEGDFALKLPRETPGPGRSLDVIRIRLSAEPDGELRHVQIAAHAPLSGPASFAVVHREIARLVNACRVAGRDEPEVVIDADDRLRYEHLLAAVSAVAVETTAAGETIPLVKRVRFAD
jgi:biopolymer transport protein ExbD